MLALFQHPEEMRKLQNNPSLIKTAVEEILRYESPLAVFKRWVLEDIEYKNHLFERGSRVAFLYGCANRDPARFPNPDTFDITRQDNPHLGFGGGTHFCIGAPLARLELQISFYTILRRFPDIQLDLEEPLYRESFVFRGLKSLPVRY